MNMHSSVSLNVEVNDWLFLRTLHKSYFQIWINSVIAWPHGEKSSMVNTILNVHGSFPVCNLANVINNRKSERLIKDINLTEEKKLLYSDDSQLTVIHWSGGE